MSKGGSQKTEVKIPQWLEDAGKSALGRADDVSRIGYTPYYGPDVAALNGQQVGAMRNTQDAAQAFGMAAPNPMAGMPQPERFAGGVRGYSSGPLFDRALAEVKKSRPGQFAAIEAQFVDPGRPSKSAKKARPAPKSAPEEAQAKRRTSESDKDRAHRRKGYKLGDGRRSR